MTKIKNTKKGMAKKTLSMSLVVAMLATSNVPVWAAEFSDGSDVNVASEAEAPVAESADEFTDDAAATADTAEAPAVDDGTEADAATASSLVYDDSKLENFKLATAEGKNGEWGTDVVLPSKSITFQNSTDLNGAMLYYYWMYDGKQIRDKSYTGAIGSWEEFDTDINYIKIRPTKEQCIEGGSFSLRVQILINGEKNFDKTYDFGAARAIDLTSALGKTGAASKVEFKSDDYNNKEQKPTPSLKSGNNYIYQVQRGDKDKLGINDFAWDYVRTDDATGENDLKSADERVNDKNVTVEAKVTAPGYKGSFVIENAFDIWQKNVIDAYKRSELNITTKTAEYEYTGEAIKPSKNDISFKDTETGDDLSDFVADVSGYDKAVGPATAGVKLAKKSTKRNELLDNYGHYDGIYFGLTQKFNIVQRDLSKCTVELQGDFTKGEMDDMISKGKSFVFGTELKLYDADHKELSGLYGEIVNKVSKENGIYYITVTPTTTTKNIVKSLKQEAATPKSSLRQCKVYFEDAVTGTTAENREADRVFETVLKDDIEYTGEAYNVSKNDVYVRDYAYSDNRRLTADLYDIECDQTTNVGTHWIKIIGKGDYAGSVLTLYYKVKPASYKAHTLNKKVVFNSAYTNAADYAKEIGLTVTAQNKAMTDNTITKKNEATTAKTFTLTSDDMTVTYDFNAVDKNNNGNYVHNTIKVTTTITNPNYLGGTKTFTENVELVHPSIADATVEILGDYTFTGKKIIPNVKVTAANGTVLKEGTDYRLDVKHGQHAGKAEVVVTAVRDCKKDTKTIYEKDSVNDGNYFTINPANINDVKVANSATYTGEEITFGAGTLKLMLGDTEVTSLFETSLPKEYKNNVNAGTATVTINVKDEWKNDFTAISADAAFKINPVELTKEQVEKGAFTVYGENGHILNFIGFEGFQYDGTAKTFKDADYESYGIKLNKKAYKLVKGKDYTIEYADNVNPDQSGKDGKTSSVYVKLSPNFTTKQSKTGKYLDGTNFTTQDGTVITDVVAKKDYRITKASVENAAVSVTNPVYDGGNKVAPTVKVTVDGKELTEGTDYVLTYEKDETYNATKENSKLVTVKGINGYVASSKTVKWGIDAKDIASDSVKVTLDKKSYKANEKPEVTVADGKTILDADEYSVAYTDMENGVLTITGEGKNYTGTKEVNYEVAARSDLADATVKGVEDVYVTGEQIKPEITVVYGKKILTEGTDYTVSYGENKEIGEGTVTITAVEGSADYKGSQTVTFQIKDYDRADLADAVINGVEESYYVTGEQITPEITVVSGNEILTEGEDYTVTYGENKEIGEGTVTITAVEGSKKFTGSQTVTFQIKDYDRADLADAVIEGLKDETVTGEQIKPEIRVVCGNKVLTEGTDYTVSYGENKEVGEGTVTITAVEGSKEYAGSKTVTFNIVEENPLVGAPVITNVEVSGNNAALILSGDVEGASGYDYVISASKDPSDKDARLDVVKNQVQTTANFKYVPQGTYYAYCHAWTRDENGKKVFGEWSNSYAFSVTAITPDTPEILSVKTKGSTITVTYKESANSTGYDVVLGKGSKKEHGETRPYQYGKYKKLNVKPGVCKAVFKNIPAGTYYVGVHSWNRSASENDNKVFSKWSNLETAKVK